MRYFLLSSILFFSMILTLKAQKTQAVPIKMVFYNTENIFDTIDDPNKNDNDFLPASKVAWTSQRYNDKLQHIARVLRAIDSINLPPVIGLAEIENIAVLNDLVTRTPLKEGRYRAILMEGSDPRGIDVALIYREDMMTCTGQRSFPSATSFNTRSILYVKLADMRKETYHFFVNHWKSREGGAADTESKRMENAAMLRHLTDSLFAGDPDARIVIMGDFNDEPANRSLAEVLGAGKPDGRIVPGGLYNLMYPRFLQGEGTLYYKDWDVFDQFIVSARLMKGKKKGRAAIEPPYSYIFKPEWILYKNRDGVMVPSRTAGSREYFGGYSDHLPVYITVKSE